MTTNSDPSKRIPKSLGTDTTLIGTYSLSDLVVAGLPAVTVLLLTRVVLPPSAAVFGYSLSTLTMPVVAVAVLAGGLFVYLTPEHVSSLEWLGQFVWFRTRSTKLDHEAARECTFIERVFPDRDVVERTDGSMVGAVKVTPPSMALATDEEWAAKAGAFQNFVNTTVAFPIQIYSRTRSFPADEYLDHYRDRLDDPDVQSNPRLESLVEAYVEWYDRELAARQMTIRDHYVIVTVRPKDVQYEYGGPLQQLASVPILGTIMRALAAPPVSAERAALFGEIDDRLGRVGRGLGTIDDCTTRRVSAPEFAELVAEYWTGSEFEYRTPERVFRTSPIVTASQP